MKHLTAVNAAKALASAYTSGTSVDTHQLERDAMAQFPTEFMQDFLAYNCDLTAFSRDFSLWIKNHWTTLVAPTANKPVTTTLRGTDSANQEWEIL